MPVLKAIRKWLLGDLVREQAEVDAERRCAYAQLKEASQAVDEAITRQAISADLTHKQTREEVHRLRNERMRRQGGATYAAEQAVAILRRGPM